MTTTTIKWNGYTIKKVDNNNEELKNLYFSIYSNLDGMIPELSDLETGYYQIVEVNQYFKIGKDFDNEEIIFPMWENNVISKYLHDISEREHQQRLAETLAQVTEFENDLHTELVWENDVAKLKPYYDYELSIKRERTTYQGDDPDFKDMYIYDLLRDGRPEVELHWCREDNQYSAYDGVERYDWHDTLKEAVKAYMDSNFHYQTDGEEGDSQCSMCGGGGCVYCEPYHFL